MEDIVGVEQDKEVTLGHESRSTKIYPARRESGKVSFCLRLACHAANGSFDSFIISAQHCWATVMISTSSRVRDVPTTAVRTLHVRPALGSADVLALVVEVVPVVVVEITFDESGLASWMLYLHTSFS